jgi:type III pantothenate kinase
VKPDIVVDVGNSRIKWGRVIPGGIGEMAAFPHDDTVGWKRQLVSWFSSPAQQWAVAGVHPGQIARFLKWLESRPGEHVEIDTTWLLDHEDKTGLQVRVDARAQVGVDRLLSALAARRRASSGSPVAVITVGTAMTVDYVDSAGRCLGGAILPGPYLMARSLHEHTAKLPHIEIDPVMPVQFWGKYTEEAIELGIASAVLGAADQLLWDWANYSKAPLQVFVTGGDSGYFRGFEFTADTSSVEIDLELTLDGIRVAAEALP